MTELNEQELISDWNRRTEELCPAPPRLVDHTLAAVRLTVGLRTPEPQAQARVLALLTRLGLTEACLGSWSDPQVRSVVEAGVPLKAWVEMPGSARPPSSCGVYLSHRQENWRERAEEFEGDSVLVIQDATRRSPSELVQLLARLPGSRIRGVCLSDDGGRATPAGARRLVRFVAEALGRQSLPVSVEWSGRNDRGLALAVALEAWRAGADTLHSSFFSVGEGCGLIPSELLLVNLALNASYPHDLKGLGEVTRELAELLGVELYANLPVIGCDAFRTGTGVHAAAILKAMRKGHAWLADLVYSGVPAAQFGFRQVVEVGPMAGASNVHFWLEQQGREAHPELVQAILAEAKASQRVLSEDELMGIVNRHEKGGVTA